MQLGRDRGSVERHNLIVAKLDQEVPLLLLVWFAVVQVATQLDGVQRRQGVAVLARLQHEGGGLDALHDRLQTACKGLPLAEVAVDAHEVLLEERALGAAQQRLVYDLALTADILKAVGGERPGQAPPHLALVDLSQQRLEAFA